jgi:hypothetical protein
MRIKHLIYLGILIMAACQPINGFSTPNPLNFTPLKVEISPDLNWMLPTMNACALKQSNIGIILASGSQNQIPELSLTFGEEKPIDGSALQIGQDNLIIVTHPENPLTELSKKDIQAIFSGQVRSWSQFTQDERQSQKEITLWDYPTGVNSQTIFQSIFLEKHSRNPYAWLAPNPELLRQAVANDPGSIGYLPARWLNNSIRALKINDLDSNDLRQPILAIAHVNPGQPEKTWLICLEQSISKAQ